MPPATDGARRFLALSDRQLTEQCAVDHYRSRGPGGQKRNKTSSAVRIRHAPTGLASSADEDRSQQVNKRRALRRLRQAIALNVRSAVDPDRYVMSDTLKACLGGRGELRIGRRDDRYWLVLSEVLDVMAACDMRLRDAAARLGLSSAQLSKFIQNDPKLLDQVNRRRREAGLKPLR